MKTKLKLNKLKEKKGMSTLEFVICFMLFIIVFTFLADMFLLIYKQYMVSSTCNQIVRQISIQGGIAKRCPDNYPGNEANYLTYDELNSWVDDLNNSYFKENDKVSIQIKYYTNPSDSSSEKIVDINKQTQTIYLDYGSYITVTINYPQKWSFWNSLTGIDNSSTFSVTKSAVTDYVSWN